MARPNWEYVRVDVLLPGNEKLDGLSGAAKWTLIEMWCYCGQHLTDGFIRDAMWKTFGTTAIRAKLAEPERELAERVDGGWMMHDYLDHQRSRAEVIDLKEKRRKAGEKGGRAKASAVADAMASAVADAVASASPSGPVDNSFVSQISPRFDENFSQSTGALFHDPEDQTPGQGTDGSYQMLKQNASKPVAEAEAEKDLTAADAVNTSSRRNARDQEIDLIVDQIQRITGHLITFEWASRVRSMLLDGRTVGDPLAYLKRAISDEPDPRKRFLPATLALPSARPLNEALRDAGVEPGHQPATDQAKAAIAAQARQALNGTGRNHEP